MYYSKQMVNHMAKVLIFSHTTSCLIGVVEYVFPKFATGGIDVKVETGLCAVEEFVVYD